MSHPMSIRLSEADMKSVSALVEGGFYVHKSEVTRTALRIGLEQMKAKCGV